MSQRRRGLTTLVLVKFMNNDCVNPIFQGGGSPTFDGKMLWVEDAIVHVDAAFGNACHPARSGVPSTKIMFQRECRSSFNISGLDATINYPNLVRTDSEFLHPLLDILFKDRLCIPVTNEFVRMPLEVYRSVVESGEAFGSSHAFWCAHSPSTSLMFAARRGLDAHFEVKSCRITYCRIPPCL
jgi:hypothetical protein